MSQWAQISCIWAELWHHSSWESFNIYRCDITGCQDNLQPRLWSQSQMFLMRCRYNLFLCLNLSRPWVQSFNISNIQIKTSVVYRSARFFCRLQGLVRGNTLPIFSYRLQRNRVRWSFLWIIFVQVPGRTFPEMLYWHCALFFRREISASLQKRYKNLRAAHPAVSCQSW